MLIRLLLSLLFLASTPALSAATVGEVIPHDLKLADQTGALQSFETLKGEKGLVLVFVRSTEWCPFCQKQLKKLNASKEAITSKGYNLVGISYDSAEQQKKFSDKNNITYTLLSDKGSEAIKAFGILNESMAPDSRTYGIPHPTIYTITADGTISAILTEEGYKNRPSLEAILKTIQ